MLPFIAGLAVGSLSIIALNNKEKIKDVTISKFDQGIDKSKIILKDAKKFTEEKIVSKINKNVPKQKELEKE